MNQPMGTTPQVSAKNAAGGVTGTKAPDADAALPIEPPATLHAWIALSRCPGIGPVLAKRLVEALGGAAQVLSASREQLARVEGIGQSRATALPAALRHINSQEILEQAQARSIRIICPDNAEWPSGLTRIPDPPVVLYLRGEILRQDVLAVGIVGARRCTLYGREQSDKFAAALARLGVTIISGGARGIDTAGHTGALRAGGRTIVIQGCGMEHCYPPENVDLYDRIVREGRGCVISELAPDQPPLPEHFPPRNRIITGMSLGILVVEANLRSGSLITARLAADDYGREVFALPGRVDSAASSGTHHLIKTGAANLVENVEDIMLALGQGELLGQTSDEVAPGGKAINQPSKTIKRGTPLFTADDTERNLSENGRWNNSVEFTAKEVSTRQSKNKVATDGPVGPTINDLTGPQQTLVRTLGKQMMGLDDLCERSLLQANVVMAELTFLQIRGIVQRNAESLFTVSRTFFLD